MIRANNCRQLFLGGMLVLGLAALSASAKERAATPSSAPAQVIYGSIQVDGLNIAYREAGDSSSNFAARQKLRRRFVASVLKSSSL